MKAVFSFPVVITMTLIILVILALVIAATNGMLGSSSDALLSRIFGG